MRKGKATVIVKSMAPKTVIMKHPPEMTLIDCERAGQVNDPRSTLLTNRSAERDALGADDASATSVFVRSDPPGFSSAQTGKSPAVVVKDDHLRTRMIWRADKLVVPSLPVSSTPPKPPRMPRTGRRAIFSKQVIRPAILMIAVTTLGIVLALPSSEKFADARPMVEQNEVRSETMAATEPVAAPSPVTEYVAAPDEIPTTEATAGALLLSGRRKEALMQYRQLALQPLASPGVLAMVAVLQQKVRAQ